MTTGRDSGAARFVRRLIAGLLLLIVAGGIGLCAAVIVAGTRMSAPVPAAIGPPPPDLGDVKRVGIPSMSGSVLQGWWLPAAQPAKGAVILIHGVRANRLSQLARARMLHERGFGVLLFDLQAHGESPGRHITFGRLEALDAAAAVDFVRQAAPGERIGIIGQSLGGAATLLGPTPLPIDALILEAVFPDIGHALSNRLKSSLGDVIGPILAPLLTPLFEALMGPLIGVTSTDLRPIDRIAGVGVPVLIASGTDDPFTPLTEAQALFEHAVEPKTFWAVDGAKHVDLERADPERYWSVVLPFLTRYLRPIQ